MAAPLVDRTRVAALARLFFALLAGVLVIWLQDPALRGSIDGGLVWRNALPVSLVVVIIYGLSGRLLLSIFVTALLVRAMIAINFIKERNMNAPLMPGDWALRHQVIDHLGFFAHYTGHGLSLALKLMVLPVALYFLWRLERRMPRPHFLTRIFCVILSCGLLYGIFSGYRPWSHVYSNEGFSEFELWDAMASVNDSGLMANLVRMSQEMQIRIPEVSRELVVDFAKSHAQDLASRMGRAVTAELPDVVVVQSEAFFDPGILNGLDLGQFVPNFERLAATGITGSMQAPTYGGGTIRTEFETLTGYPMWAFPAIAYPYYGLAGAWMPSVPRRLQAFGYTTTLMHPYDGDFWNRQNVMPELGFEKSFYLKDFPDAKYAGLFVSDEALFDSVLSRLAKEGPGPTYTMAITMENHGPWTRPVTGIDAVVDNQALPQKLSAAGKMEMTYYLSHLANGDRALRDFASKLMARPRWTVLLFYGDHLPALDNAFHDLGFDNGDLIALQRTRYMIISNRPLKARTLDLNAYDLPGLLFDTLDLPEDGYLAFDSVLRDAAERDDHSQLSHYGALSFDAARMEISCKRKLSMTATCSKRTNENEQ